MNGSTPKESSFPPGCKRRRDDPCGRPKPDWRDMLVILPRWQESPFPRGEGAPQGRMRNAGRKPICGTCRCLFRTVSLEEAYRFPKLIGCRPHSSSGFFKGDIATGNVLFKIRCALQHLRPPSPRGKGQTWGLGRKDRHLPPIGFWTTARVVPTAVKLVRWRGTEFFW